MILKLFAKIKNNRFLLKSFPFNFGQKLTLSIPNKINNIWIFSLISCFYIFEILKLGKVMKLIYILRV